MESASSSVSPDPEGIRYGSPTARWVVAATVLGSGMAFLDGSVVNVALPAIGKDLHASITGLQWTINSYLVTLTALLLLGGSLGDRFGRRRAFVIGLVGFSISSVLCAVAPNLAFLTVARAIQGMAGALLVPGSLSIIAATFHAEDRGRAIGAWSGLAGVASSIGPFLGGWLIDVASWRLIFVINLPLAGAALFAARHVPETRSEEQSPIDLVGAALITVSLGTISYACIEHHGASSLASAVVGVLSLVAFLVRERRASHPMLPLGIFRSRQFSGSNLTTFAVYAGLSGAIFLVVLRLQVSLGYDALEAGAALAPFTLVMLLLSSRAGQLSQRIGPRLPMTFGPLLAAGGIILLAGVTPGDTYSSGVLPGVLVFSLGMSLTVAPLTSAVLASVGDSMTGVASGVNNAVARLGGLIAVAVLPALAGISTSGAIGSSLDAGYGAALRIAGAACALGGVVAFVFVRESVDITPAMHPSPYVACQDCGVLHRPEHPVAVDAD